MSKIYLITTIVLIFLCTFLNAQSNKDREAKLRASLEKAKLRASLAKAKSIGDMLLIIKTTVIGGRSAQMVTNSSLVEAERKIMNEAEESNSDFDSTIVPRNGGCEPRIICEEVPVDRVKSNNVASFPQCVEVHRCGGCCQEGQFQCLPVKEESVTFSPLLLVSLDGTQRIDVVRPLTLMNHTRCECKCSKTEAQCREHGKILDSTTCECNRPICQPDCYRSSMCSFVYGSDTPRCTCRRQIPGQSGNYCFNPKERPNQMCSGCERAYG